jgi:hypothetical protein
MYDNNGGGLLGFGGLGSAGGNIASNPLFLAGLQMIGNNTPKIGAIPNTMEGVPTTLMAGQDRQRQVQENERKAAEQARQRQLEAARTESLSAALVDAGLTPEQARVYARNPSAANLGLDTMFRKKDEAAEQRFFGPGGPGGSQQPAPDAAPQTNTAPAPPAAPFTPGPAAAAQPAAPQQVADTGQRFDAFARAAQGKSIADVAAQSGNQTTAARLLNAAGQQGMSPDATLTGPLLSDPAVAMPLARALGIGADMPDGHWLQAHAAAFQMDKARQAAREAQQAAQQAGQPAPPAPGYLGKPELQTMEQRGPAQGQIQTMEQRGPTTNAEMRLVQQQQPAPAQPPVPVQTATDQAMAAREQNRIAGLRAEIAKYEPFMGHHNPKIKAAATARVAEARAELAKEPKFQVIGKNEMTGETQYGFVKGGDVVPYTSKSAQDSAPVDERGLYSGETIEERLQSVPADQRSFIKEMIEGRQPPPSSYAMKLPLWERRMREASKVDPDMDYSKWAARVATRKDFDSGKTAQNLISMGQTYGHFGKLTDAIDKLDNSDFPMVNTARNAALSATGSEKASNVMTAAKAVSSEVARVFKGVGVIGEKETKEWLDTLKPNMSPEQFKGSVRTLLDLIDSRVQEQGARWDAQFPNEPRNLYSKNAESALDRVRTWTETGAKGTAGPGAAPVTSLNPFEAEMRRRGLLK